MHLAVVVLAYVFGRHLFGDERLAMLRAVLFGLHPSKVESVAWIGSSMVDGLGADIFFRLADHVFEMARERKARWMSASVAWFAAAMFTKETMVAIPILIGVYLWLNAAAASDGTGQRVRSVRYRWRHCAYIAAVWGGVDRVHGDPASGDQAARCRAPNIFIQLSRSPMCGLRLMRSGGTSGIW